MIIKRSKYEEILNQSKLVPELEKETKRLAALITSETKDCKIGTWCKECKHLGRDRALVKEDISLDFDCCPYWVIVAEGGEVQYCKKYLHKVCTEFEMR